ncbi:MAG: lipopolysaccharide heptosyltransferase II [Candidatus Omnitrophota bacterium]|nr:lipopolysaccharide heptosyltransferase II [Candidatus Omnitrophota bacterium]
MNILQVLPELNVGGVETGTVDLSVSLVKRGHKSIVASSGGELALEIEKQGVKHYTLDLRNKSPLVIFRNTKKLSGIIRGEKIEIVHARSRAPAWSAFFAARMCGIPFITTCHGYYSQHLFSCVMGWGKLVIVPSNIIGKHEMNDFGVPFDRIRHIPRSVDIEKFKFNGPQEKSRTDFVVGIIGRITPIKGHTYFLKAMSKVVRRVPNVKIWIVGETAKGKDNYREEIDVLIKRLGLSPNVEFLGKQRDVPHILNQLNILVASTITEEAFGRVIIEAQSAGVPVVATRVGGVVDIVDDGVNGLLVAPRDIQAMAQAIIKIMEDINLAKNLAAAGRKNVSEKFTLEQMVEKTLKVYEEAVKPNVLIIKLSALGDVILSIPAIRALRDKYPMSKITCLTSKDCEEVISRCPYIDELIVYDSKFKDKGIFGIFRIAKVLRERCPDICIDLQNNKKSHLFSFLSLAPNRYGYDNRKFSFLLNHKVALPKGPLVPLEHQGKIMEMLGVSFYDKKLELWPTKDDEERVGVFLKNEWLKAGQKLVGINISSSVRWQTKRWPAKFIVKLSELFIADDIRLILTGLEKDLDLARDIATNSKAKPVIACGKTSLNELACLIKRCNAYISCDSAPLHIAASMQTPFVALFGPTDPLRHLPPSDKSMLLRRNLPCSPCYKPDCKDVKCMSEITPEEVFMAAKKLLRFYSN